MTSDNNSNQDVILDHGIAPAQEPISAETEGVDRAEGGPGPNQAVIEASCFPPYIEPAVRSILQRISNQRQRPLFALVDSELDGATPHDIYRWRDQIASIAATGPLDVLIESPGGSLSASYQIARLLGRYANSWTALVPTMAASGATLICLGSSEVVLSPIAQLGPVDPQVISRRPGKFFFAERQSPVEAFETVQYLQKFMLSTLDATMVYLLGTQGIAPQTALETASRLAVDLTRPVMEKIDPYDLGSFTNDSKLAQDYCMRVAKPVDARKETQRRVNIESLVERYAAHDFFLDSSEAEAIGFNVTEPSSDLEELFCEARPILSSAVYYVGIIRPQGHGGVADETTQNQ